jgi:hypothetical protein
MSGSDIKQMRDTYIDEQEVEDYNQTLKTSMNLSVKDHLQKLEVSPIRLCWPALDQLREPH